MPRDAFPGYDDPINTDLEPEDALRAIMGCDVADVSEDHEQEEE